MTGDQRHRGDERLPLALDIFGEHLRQDRVGVHGRAPHPHQVYSAPVDGERQSGACCGTLAEIALGQRRLMVDLTQFIGTRMITSVSVPTRSR